MSGFNLASKTKEEQDKIAIDLIASGVAFKERLGIPVVAEAVAREQPDEMREYFMDRLRHYRQLSVQLPDANAPEYKKASTEPGEK
jgi:DNA polymerase III subunit theta